MSEVEKTILLGLQKYGRNKNFAEILDEAQIPHDPNLRLAIADTLKKMGLICNVSYAFPIKLKAELTAKGSQLINTVIHQSPGRNGSDSVNQIFCFVFLLNFIS